MDQLLLKIFEFSALVNMLEGSQTYFVMQYFMLCVNWNILTNCRLSLVQMKINGQNVNGDMTYYSLTDSSYHKFNTQGVRFLSCCCPKLKREYIWEKGVGGGWNYCFEAGYLNIITYGWKALFYEDWIVYQYKIRTENMLRYTIVQLISCTGWVIWISNF